MLHEYTFLIFFFLMIIFTFFVYRKVPETKNRTFEEIANQFQPGGDIDVEEIMTGDDDDVFATSSPSTDVTSTDDVRTSATPTTQGPNKAATKIPAEEDQLWVIRL